MTLRSRARSSIYGRICRRIVVKRLLWSDHLRSALIISIHHLSLFRSDPLGFHFQMKARRGVAEHGMGVATHNGLVEEVASVVVELEFFFRVRHNISNCSEAAIIDFIVIEYLTALLDRKSQPIPI